MRPTIQLRALHPAQARIRSEARRFNVVSCGRRFGKTDFGLDEAIDGHKGLLEGFHVGWFAPHSRFFEEAWLAASNLLHPITLKSQEQKKRISLTNGAVLEFWGLEDPDAGRSRKYGKVIIDEAASVVKLEQAWQQSLMPTLIDWGGNAWFLSSPRGFNFFKTVHDYGNAKTPKRRADWMSWIFSSYDNPHLQPSEIAKLCEEMPELVREQEIMGRFVDLGGASVHRDWVRYGELPPVPCSIAIGVDLAISLADSAAYTAIVTIARLADGRVFVLEVKRLRATFHAILQQIIAAAERWSPAVVGIETNQFQAAVVQELLRTTTLPIVGVTAHKDKLVRFQPMLSRYEQGLVYHVPALPSEFEEELFAFPLGQYKDMCDALGLAFTCCPDPGGGSSVAYAGHRYMDWSWIGADEHELERMTGFEEGGPRA